jgi:hypothetical protein
MDILLRYIRMLMVLSLAITGLQLVQDRGGGQWFFTLLGLVVALNLAPYLGAIAVMRRVPPRWAQAVGTSTCLFGLADVAVRMQAFNFPTENSDGRMALWLPLSALAAIPLLTVVCYAGVAAFSRGGAATEGGSPQP